jgi:hypothetical protein
MLSFDTATSLVSGDSLTAAADEQGSGRRPHRDAGARALTFRVDWEPSRPGLQIAFDNRN